MNNEKKSKTCRKSIVLPISTDLPFATSTSLIERVRSGDEDAWAEFAASYSPLIYSRCRQYGLNADDSAEVLQVVLLKVHRKVGKFEPRRPDKLESSFRGWLRTIASRAVMDHFRSRRHQFTQIDTSQLAEQVDLFATSLLNDDLHSDSGWTPSDTISELLGSQRTVKKMLVAVALRERRGKVHEHTWQAFWRSTILGMPATQIAKELGMTENAVRQAKYDTLKKLRKDLIRVTPMKD